MTWPSTPHIAIAAIALTAALWDLKSRRVPNALTLGGALLGLAMHAVLNAWFGLAFALSGWAVGLLLFFPVFALGGMGAGDVKLLAAFGAWLGPWGALWTALYGALAGGLMALVVVLARGYTSAALRNVWSLLGSWILVGVRPVEGVTLSSSAGPRLPYAVPLAVGALLTVWLR